MKTNNYYIIIFLIFYTLAFSAKRLDSSRDVGDLPDRISDRAKGYSVQGKVKNAVLNFGNFIDWDYRPSGVWREYAYLPNVSFMAGVPGSIKLSEFNDWDLEIVGDNPAVWYSRQAYDAWNEVTEYDTDTGLQIPARFAGIAYNMEDDRGDIALQRFSITDLGAERKECSLGDSYSDEESCEEAFETNDNGDIVYGDWVYKSDIPVYAQEAVYEWFMDIVSGKIYLLMLEDLVDPESVSSVGLIYPWAFRPKFLGRDANNDIDKYAYGSDDGWESDANYAYYGATVSESWFTNFSNQAFTDWQAASGSAVGIPSEGIAPTHNTTNNAGDLFGSTRYADEDDPYSLLAHSDISSTWPTTVNPLTLEIEPYWPGWYADEYFGDQPEEIWAENGISSKCRDNGKTRTNPDCWKEGNENFISDSDIYMQFDDRWAHLGNRLEGTEYQSTGYPMGLTIRSIVHSYGVSYAEDIMYVSVRIRNESGDYDAAFKYDQDRNKVPLKDSNGDPITNGKGLIMPDGTQLNNGKGFNYEKVALGFYMDADVLMGNLDDGYVTGLHTNDDDFMEYYDCAQRETVAQSPEWLDLVEDDFNGRNYCPVVDGDTLRISMAMVYDYDGNSGGVTGFGHENQTSGDLGIVATQLLDSPYATGPVDLDNDSSPDLQAGDKLKMTDWHWFDWFNRPGVVQREGSNSGSFAGSSPEADQAANKEEIQYKLLSGTSTDISSNESVWYFHTKDPNTDDESLTPSNSDNFNPHFDDVEGLKETSFFLEGNQGLDCVLIMSCSPFDLEVGEEINFSFCIIFGEDRQDLLKNAEFAQIMYNAHYQGYTAPSKTKVAASTSHNQVKLHWTKSPEASKDIITGYTDFEGYKIYKSTDSGATWGDQTDLIYDTDNTFAGWQPYQQFDLSSNQDKAFCVLGFENKCHIGGIAIDNENIDSENTCEQNKYCSDTSFSDESSCLSANKIWDYGVWNNYEDINQDGFWSAGESYYCINDITRDVEVSGVDPQASWLNLGSNSGFNSIIPCDCSDSEYLTKEECESQNFTWECNYYTDSDGTTYDYTYVDNNVIDGFEYTYSITSYDTGVMSDRVSIIQDEQTGQWALDTVSVPDPNGWGAINPFEMLESGQGSSELDDNYVKAIPGYNPQTDWSLIEVVPNPFIRHSAYESNDYQLKWMIRGLPEDCKISIYTVTGELVDEFRHASTTEAFAYWDLRNQNEQEIAPGLYFFTIEDLTNNIAEPYVGKFVVIR